MRLDAHRVKRRLRHRQLIPEIQIGTAGDPISIVDSVAGALILAIAFAAIAWLLGFDPRPT